MLIQQYRSLLHEDALDDGLLALLEDLLQLGLARLAKTPHQHGAVSGDQAVIIRRTHKVIAAVHTVKVEVPDSETGLLHELVLHLTVDPASHKQL